MMDPGDANFSLSSSNFILLPSQDETQEESLEEDEMRRILTTLPALQLPRPRVQPVVTAATSLHTDLCDETSTDEENRKGTAARVLATDSEMEPTKAEKDQAEVSDVNVSESVEESEENADVTVIEKKLKDDSDVIADTEISTSCPASPVEPDRSGQRSKSQSSSQNESSFQSKDRSNLGSYDQCEVYGTQKGGHAHGQRFRLFQSSQEDVFGDNDGDNEYVSTPAEHLGSLQLSSKPMLVPETVDETESEVPLTPPLMIPASPTDQENTAEEESMYNVNAANTLADHSKGFNYSDSSSISSRGSGDKTVMERQEIEHQEMDRITPIEDQEFVMQAGPTLAGDVVQQQEEEEEESLHLHLSASHPNESSCLQQISPERDSESPEVIDYVTETPKKRPPPESVSSSQNRTRISEDQSESRTVRLSTPKTRAPPILPRELTRTPEDVIIIDSGTGDTGGKEEEQFSLHLSPTQGEITQNNKPSQTSSKISAKGNKSHQHKRQKHKRHTDSHLHKRQKHKHTENEKPFVVWRDNEATELPEREIDVKDTENDIPIKISDATDTTKETVGTVSTSKSSSGDRFSDDFHLTLPKGGDLLHPVGEKAMETDQNEPDETGQQHLDESENISEESFERPKSPTLTLSMIHVDSEAVSSEHVFRLEKPEIMPGDIEPSEDNQQDDIFRRAKIKSPRKHWKYIQDDDSDEDYISPNQPQRVTQPTTSKDSEVTKTDNNVSEQHQTEPAVQEPNESTENTVPYDVDVDPESSKTTKSHKLDPSPHEANLEVLEAIPIGQVSDRSSASVIVETVEPSMEVEESKEADDKDAAVDIQGSEVMRPPSTPVMSQDRQSTVERPKTPASVKNILKAYSDIIHKTTPLRQRSASVDVTHQGPELKTSLSRQYSHDVSLSQSGRHTPSQTKEQSQKLSQLTIQTQTPFVNGASVSKGGSGSPKGGSASPKGGWMSARKLNTGSLQDMEKVPMKSGSVSPNSNPPKSPKGLNITEISHELLQSFKQSKKNRHHSGSSTSGKLNGNGNHMDSKSTPKNGSNGNPGDNNGHTNHHKSDQNGNGFHGDKSLHYGNHGDKKSGQMTGSDRHADDKTDKKGVHSEDVSEDKTVYRNKTVTSSGHASHKSILSSPPSKQILSTPRTTDTCNLTMSPRPSGIENQAMPSAVGSQGQGQSQNRTPLPQASTVISVQKSASTLSYSKIKSTRKKEKSRQKTKNLVSSAERTRRRTSVDSNTSAKITTGSFVSSTQKFLHKETSIEPLSTTTGSPSLDPFKFQGSQSQRETRSAPCLRKYTSSSFERTPVSTRKRKKVILKKTGVKKQRVSDNAGNPGNNETVKTSRSEKDAGSTRSDKDPGSTSHSSDPTVTTIGSLQSIPSSISQASPVGEPIVSPSSSGSRASAGAGSGSNQRRLSLEPLPDTLQLHTEDENYQQVTVVTEVTKFYIMGTKTKRQVIGSQGQVLECTTTEQKGDPVIVEEKTHKKVQLIYVPSPSRSVSSLTSGDLADISSSLSRSGSSSLGSKVSITGGSFDQSQKSPDQSQPQKRLERSDSGKGQGRQETGTSQSERRTSEFLEPQPSTSKQIQELLRKDILKQTPKPATPEVPTKPPSTGVTPLVPSSIAIPSDTDGSDVGTPLGSTINKTGSYLHSRTVSEESPRPVEGLKKKASPKASDSLFSSTEEKGGNQDGAQTRRQSSGTSDGSLIPAGQKRLTQAEPVPTESDKEKISTSGEATSSSDQISPKIPYQDQAISSSGSEENTALVPSTGETGSRVIAKWKDGHFYPGTVKGKDRYGRFQVRFDDGDSMHVKTAEVMLVEKLPAGQSVLVQTQDGDFESGMIIEQNENKYMVETDSGSRGLYSQSQVILTGDQASCLIADKGNEIMIELTGQPHQPVNVGDVSLENLLDAPRRSAKKAPPETKVKDEDRCQGQGSSRGRKRKLEPQATSTPTPKGKQDTASPKKRKTAAGFVESPLLGATSSPVSARRSPRKARVGLFTGDVGPIPTKKLFRGMMFLFSNVDKTAEQKKQERQLLKDSSLETSTDESAVEEEVAVPFDKNHLKAQIEAGGGKVLDQFDFDVIDTSKKCYILSSTYQRTIKYLQCLACGVMCVAHNWVINSCKEEKLLDHKDYILPAGISLERKKVMEWRSRKDVLIGVKAFVVSKDSKFCECWSEILRLARGTVLPKLQYSGLDVIVTDSSCSQATVRQAETHGVALVSTEWVIQSLINGKQMKYNGHPRYQYDFMI